MSSDLRRWITVVEAKPVVEDIGSLPTSLLTAIPDDLMQQLGFFLKIATRMGWQNAVRLLQSIMQNRS